MSPQNAPDNQIEVTKGPKPRKVLLILPVLLSTTSYVLDNKNR